MGWSEYRNSTTLRDASSQLAAQRNYGNDSVLWLFYKDRRSSRGTKFRGRLFLSGNKEVFSSTTSGIAGRKSDNWKKNSSVGPLLRTMQKVVSSSIRRYIFRESAFLPLSKNEQSNVAGWSASTVMAELSQRRAFWKIVPCRFHGRQ